MTWIKQHITLVLGLWTLLWGLVWPLMHIMDLALSSTQIAGYLRLGLAIINMLLVTELVGQKANWHAYKRTGIAIALIIGTTAVALLIGNLIWTPICAVSDVALFNDSAICIDRTFNGRLTIFGLFNAGVILFVLFSMGAILFIRSRK